MQRCHCCARLWRGASTSVVALLPRVGFQAESRGQRARDTAGVWGRLQARASQPLRTAKSNNSIAPRQRPYRRLPSKVVDIACLLMRWIRIHR